MRAIAKALVMSACVLALGACGGDDGDDSSSAGSSGSGSGGTSGSGSGGTSGAGGSGGSGGTGGTSGTSGSGGTGGSTGGSGGTGGMMAEPVTCGGETCPAPSNTRLRACCVEGTDECGEKIAGGFFGMCAVPATPDDECEGISIMTFPVVGCCTPEGRCGIGAGMIFGEPCTSIEEIVALGADAGVGDADGGTADGGMMGMSPFGALPDPKACTP